MTASFIILCIAATAMVGFATSGLIGVGLAFGRRALERRAPAAQARILLGLALMPVCVATAVMAASLAPAFGWIVDHCVTAVDPHAHPHICVHHESVLPAWPITALAGLFALRWLAAGARLVVLGGSALYAGRALKRQARAATMGINGSAYVLPFDEPQAFVLGALRPVLFVTRGLLSADHRDHLQAVLAHERAHVRRRDSLRRLAANLAFASHLPGVARMVERRLARAQEMAADEDAAEAVGSRLCVARALVHMTRASQRRFRAALAFAHSDVELRVHALLDPGTRVSGPGPRAFMAAALFALAVIAVEADGVHHGVEVVLGLFGG